MPAPAVPALSSSWVHAPLGELCDLINGDRGKNYPGRKAFVSAGIPFVSAGDLNDGGISTERLGYIPKATFDVLRSGKVRPGDILYCIRGSLGKLAINTSFKEAAIASSLVILRPHSGLDAKFIFYYLMSPLAARMIAKFDNGTAQPNLACADLGRFEVLIPGHLTQRRIVAKIEELFSALDNAVASLTAARDQLKAYRQSLLDAAITGKLLRTNRQMAQQVQVSEVVEELGQGWSPKCHEHPRQSIEQWAVIKTTAIQHLRFDQNENKALPDSLHPRHHLEVESGDLLITRAGPRKRVGVACLVTTVAKRLLLCDRLTESK